MRVLKWPYPQDNKETVVISLTVQEANLLWDCVNENTHACTEDMHEFQRKFKAICTKAMTEGIL